MEAIKALLAQITTFWAGRDKRFKRNAIIIASSVLAVVIIASILLNQVNYATLYSGLNAEDSSTIITTLAAQKVPSKVVGDAILVPAADADRLRMSLSTQVKNGFNLDILKQGQGLGLTEGDKQDYRNAQREYNLQNAIKTLEGVQDATVMLTVPEDSPLVITSNREEATASVILTLKENVELAPSQVRAIAAFVQKAVKGLKIENISIMDSNMENLDVTADTKDEGTTKDHIALQSDVQTKLRKHVMALLQPVFGVGKVEAQVSVTLDFDSKTVDSVKFEPVVDNKEGIAVSIDKIREQIVNGTGSTGEPGTTTNTGTAQYPVVNVDNGTYQKNADKINYEVNSIKEHIVQAQGAVKSLSVSVVVDNTDLKDDNSESIRELVATGMGVSKDFVAVKYLPMLGTKAASDALVKENELKASSLKNQQSQFYIIIGAVVLVLVVAMMLLFMDKRAKAKAILDQQKAVLAAEAAANGYTEELEQMEEAEEIEEFNAIKIVKDSGTKEQIGSLIEKNPELVANLLRSWLADEQE